MNCKKTDFNTCSETLRGNDYLISLPICLGESGSHECSHHSWTQRYNHVTDGMLRIHCLLVTQRDLLLYQFRRLPYRLWRLVLPFHHPLVRCQSCEAIRLVEHISNA